MPRRCGYMLYLSRLIRGGMKLDGWIVLSYQPIYYSSSPNPSFIQMRTVPLRHMIVPLPAPHPNHYLHRKSLGKPLQTAAEGITIDPWRSWRSTTTTPAFSLQLNFLFHLSMSSPSDHSYFRVARWPQRNKFLTSLLAIWKQTQSQTSTLPFSIGGKDINDVFIPKLLLDVPIIFVDKMT